MMRLSLGVSLCLLLFCFAAQASAQNTIVKFDKTKLNGTWRADANETGALLLIIDDQKLEMKVSTGGKEVPVITGSVKLADKQPESYMDWTNLRTDGREVPDNLCLYQLTGDTLLVIGGGPSTRPTRFYSGPGSEPKTLIFMRVKPAK